MDEIHYCQMQTKEGPVECGFLVGSMCRANPSNPFWIDSGFHNRIKTVGCQSWQRYIDYGERRERFGQVALDTERTAEGPSETGPFLGPGPLPELQVPEMGNGGLNRRKDTVPMRVLQEGSASGRSNCTDNKPVGSNLTCVVCKKPAVASDQGWWYCIDCATKLGLEVKR
jgi:hypothetical protein